jgi:hypothetical protein
MENVSRILEDLNAVIDGSTRKPSVASEITLGEDAEALLCAILADDRVRALNTDAANETISTLLEMATRAGETVIWHDPNSPPAPGSIKAQFNEAAKLILLRHPPAQATAAGDVGLKLWAESVEEVIKAGKLFDTRTTKKTPDLTVVDANYGQFMHVFKEKLAKIGFDLTKQGQERMVDQIEKQIKAAGADLASKSAEVSAEAKSRAGKILASTKKRTSYAGVKAAGKGKGQAK